jgi:hypothetical protein
MYGVLELHLQKDRYEYEFRTLDGGVRDSGSAHCRRGQESHAAAAGSAR